MSGAGSCGRLDLEFHQVIRNVETCRIRDIERPFIGDWSLKDIVGHLASWEAEVVTLAARDLRDGRRPKILDFDQDELDAVEQRPRRAEARPELLERDRAVARRSASASSRNSTSSATRSSLSNTRSTTTSSCRSSITSANTGTRLPPSWPAWNGSAIAAPSQFRKRLPPGSACQRPPGPATSRTLPAPAAARCRVTAKERPCSRRFTTLASSCRAPTKR